MTLKAVLRSFLVVAVGVGTMMSPMPARAQQPLVSPAQPTNELTLLEQAIKNYVSSNAGMKQGVRVQNMNVEGLFASASISAEGAEAATVFMKKSSGQWVGIFLGTGLGPGECEAMGFPRTSTICPHAHP